MSVYVATLQDDLWRNSGFPRLLWHLC